jgi:hypothetical protein
MVTHTSTQQPEATLPLIAQHITAWVSTWQQDKLSKSPKPLALAPLSRIDADVAVLLTLYLLRDLMKRRPQPTGLKGLMKGKAKVIGLAVAIGSAVERRVIADSEQPWGGRVRYRVGMVLLDAIVAVSGWYEFVTYPLHVAAKLRVAPHVFAPRPGGEEWLLSQLGATCLS